MLRVPFLFKKGDYMTKYDVEKYDIYLNNYIDLCKKQNKVISNKTELKSYNIPTIDWFVRHCPNEEIKCEKQFQNWCGFPSVKYHPSKEVLAEYIREMREKFGKPMQIRDFNCRHGYHDVSISLIKEVWGTFNNMKEYVGLDSKRHEKKLDDLTGRKYGYLTVLDLFRDSKHNRDVVWRCECECGNEKFVTTNSLLNNKNISCGCHDGKPQRSPVYDMVGKTFNELTVIERAEDYISPSGKHTLRWKCRCSCGNYTMVTTNALVQNKTKSCGCMGKNIIGQKFGMLTVLEKVDSHVSKNGRKRSKYKCICECGNHTYVLKSNLVSGNIISCGCHTKSKGEIRLCESMDKLNIKYIFQYEHPELVSRCNNPLRVDFYLPEFNTFIEYDGEAHYQPIRYGGRSQDDANFYFEVIQNNDSIKNEYCRVHNINMVRIPYWDYDKIDDYLLKIIM